MACRIGIGAPHSSLTMRQRNTPMKIWRKVTAIARPIQPALARSMREARSEKLALRSARKSSATEINTFIAESRIRRISPALAKFVRTLQSHAARRVRKAWAPWYGFGADLAIGERNEVLRARQQGG